MSKHAVVVEDGQRTKRIGRRLKVGAGIFGGMMAIGTGVAVAAWLVTGSGTGSVGTASIQNLGIAVDAVTGYYPGLSGQTTVRVSNPNGYPVALTSVNVTSEPACYVVTVDPLPANASVVAGARAAAWENSGNTWHADDRYSFPINISMPASSGPSCSATTFTPTVTVNGQVGS